MKKIYAVGDIHGCFEKLKFLMGKIQLDAERDTLVFLGDYIDRGAQSFEVVQYLIKLRREIDDVVFLKGNHEDLLLKYLAGQFKLTYLLNGGAETLESYRMHRNGPQNPLIPDQHMDFFASLLLYHESSDYIFVHAGLREYISLSDQNSEDLLWIRDAFISSDYDFGKRVVFGHTPFAEPLVRFNKIGIDTGAVYGNKLTCVELPACKFYFS